MEKVYTLNSAQASSPFAPQRPKSLKYYLSASLHHRIGRFTTAMFFSQNQSPPDEPVNLASVSPTERSQLKKKLNEDKTATAGMYSNVADPGPFANYEQTRSDPDLVKEKVKLSKEVLETVRTVFPIDLFPDTIVLDRTTLNITERTFFFSNKTLSIRLEDILNAKVNVGPFLGSLTIASRILSSEDHFTINNLWRKDAIHLKHLIQGYIIALHNEIEISHLGKDELVETISELGHDLNS